MLQCESVSRHSCATSILVISVLCVTQALLAQHQPKDYCQFTYYGYTSNRVIAPNSVITAECGGDGHSAPYGNWGVNSIYGPVKDANQFPGWKPGTAWASGDSIWQWNSCTTSYTGSTYNNAYGVKYDGYYQDSPLTRDLGYYIYKKPIDCQGSETYPLPSSIGCGDSSSLTVGADSLSLYELDFDENYHITTLSFPGVNIDLNCNYYGCSEVTIPWKGESNSSKPYTKVHAKYTVRVSASYVSDCSW